jgi:hypothetical protein
MEKRVLINEIAEEYLNKIFFNLKRRKGPLSYENWVFYFEGEDILFLQHAKYIEINLDFFSFFKVTFNMDYWELETLFIKMAKKHISMRKSQYIIISNDTTFKSWKTKFLTDERS